MSAATSGIWFWVLVFSVPIVSIIFGSLEKMSRNRALMRMAETGKPIPPELLRGVRERNDRSSNLRGGIIAMFAGVGIFVMFLAMTGGIGSLTGQQPLFPRDMSWLPFIGAIPFTIGLGMIVASLFQKDTEHKD